MIFIWIKGSRSRRRRTIAASLVAACLVTAGCDSHGTGTPGTSGAQKVDIVASTSVWGSVVTAVAGEHGRVKPIIASSVEDPHSFEAGPADAAAISDAQLVVYNGGGYDHFVDDVLAQHPTVKKVDAFTAGGQPAGSNPHVFYDMPTVSAVVKAVADQLAGIDPANAGDYHANADKYTTAINGITSIESAIATAHSGVPVIATEDVPHYLITATKLTDRTPEGYYKAIDGDTDPAPVDMAEMLDLINSHQVKVVFFNPQTATTATRRILDAAKAANVTMLDTTETLPENTDFIAWQRNMADALANALKPQ